MNLGQIELSVYDQLGMNANPDPALIRRVRRYLNDAHRQILGRKGFGLLRRATLTTASVASDPLMVLPQAAVAIIAIVDRTNNRPLTPISLQDIRYRDPGQNFTSSIPDAYTVLNFSSAIARDPSTPSSLFVISDSASDSGGIAASIEGVVTGGDYRRASVSLNGLTGVDLSATISTWVHVTKFYVSGSATGSITLREGSGAGTELARIAPGKSSTRYTQVHLSGVPSSSQTYYCDVDIHIEDMTAINDEPLIPEDWHWLLTTAALMRDYLKREKIDQYREERSVFSGGMSELSSHIRRRAGISTGGQRGTDGSRRMAGSGLSSPWFPA